MATLDLELGAVVVRVVYDGPPFSGKTTSLRSLAGMLAERRRSEVFTPEELAGRTLYFDWMEYVGGLIAGYQVRCQIVSVPGQRALEARRRYLLSGADSVVFVADSTLAGLEASTLRFAELDALLQRGDEPPIGVVVQANKRDLPSVASVDEIKARFGNRPNLGVVEAVAETGLGVRETFVFAVRLALDRARYQMQGGTLVTGKPEIETGQQLFSQLSKIELGEPTYEIARASVALAMPRESRGEAMSPLLPEEVEPEVRTAAPSSYDPRLQPALPNAAIPSGLVWPPVSGRILLHELEVSQASLQRLSDGEWSGRAGDRWLLRSREHERFTSLEEGRRVLLDQVRLHASLKDLLSEGRCLALAEDGQGGWRLWSFVRQERSLRDAVVETLRESDPVAGARLLRLARLLERAATEFPVAVMALPAGLDTVGVASTKPAFIDFLPSLAPGGRPIVLSAELIARLFVAQLEDLRRHDSQIDAARLAVSLHGALARDPSAAVLLGPMLDALRG